MQLKWRLSHAQGYLQLGMVNEAAAELGQIPASERDRTEVLTLRAAVLQEQGRWRALRLAAAELVRREPAEPASWITWAFATRRSRSIIEAEHILLEAEIRHPTEPTIQFNLGCYACLRGDLSEAQRRVRRAIALDRGFREHALADADLEALRKLPGGAPF
ncbi:hypothetical protein MASR2M8_24510 [Opitutaceae bacterium]